MKKILSALVVSFALSSAAFGASMSCFQTPPNDDIFNEKAGFNKQAMREQGYAETENPAQELMMCAMAMATQPLAESNCKCIERVKELCEYEYDDGKIKYNIKGGAQLGWCLAFPLHMWGRG